MGSRDAVYHFHVVLEFRGTVAAKVTFWTWIHGLPGMTLRLENVLAKVLLSIARILAVGALVRLISCMNSFMAGQVCNMFSPV